MDDDAGPDAPTDAPTGLARPAGSPRLTDRPTHRREDAPTEDASLSEVPPPPQDVAVPVTTRHPLARLWDHATHFRTRIVVATLLSIANKLSDLAPPFLIGAAVDIVVAGDASFVASTFGVVDARDQLLVLAAISAAVWLLESVFEYGFNLAWRNLAQDVQHDLRVEAYDHVQGLETAYFEDRSTGGLLAVLNDDVNQLERFLDRGANDILQVLTTVIVIGAAFFVLVGNLAWFAFAPVPVILFGSFRFQSTLEPRYARVREEVGLLNGTLANDLSGNATIKAFTAEERETERVREMSSAYAEANRGAIRLSSAFVPLIRIAILAGFTAILVFGGFRALEGTLAVGTYSVMVFITQRLLWPLTRLGETFDLYQRGMASTRRVLDLLDVRPSIVDGPRDLPTPVAGGVRFEDVGFAYADGGEVLRRLDLHVPPGRTHAIVGATGAGKSTVVKLLLRLYDPTRGRVTLDGYDLRELTLGSLRGTIGLVSQDVFLFHGTVRENITYGRPDATDEEVRHAAELAEALEFVEALPQAWDTVVGERGQKLSGGQRQRLSIARAILSDPAVLVLDEATSAVDNETEAAIQRSLERVSRDRTTIVIAHRLSTVRDADRIHVLEAGSVVESGRHDDLVARGGLYAALWRVQTGERDRPV
jgi:ATP-binding cassette subfamily B protein